MKKRLYPITLCLLLISCVTHADTPSNISLSTSSVYTVTGLYLQALAAGTCPGTSVFSQPASSNFGTMWTGGITLNNQTITLGANYLYEMIYIAIFEGYYSSSSGSINSPTIPGSNSYNSGSGDWCIRLGIAGGTPVTPNSSVTTSLLPFASSTSISITCNDSLLQCLADSPVTQSF